MKTIEPPVEPRRKTSVRDYSCVEKYTEEWDEGDVHITATHYENLIGINLKQLNEAYKDYNPEDIQIIAVQENSKPPSLIILRPQKEEEFEAEMKKYIEKLAWYESWKRGQE